MTSNDIARFINGNGGRSYHETQVNYTIKYFASQRPGCITYYDFMPLILPCEDSYLRAVATQRPARRVESHEYLHSSVE